MINENLIEGLHYHYVDYDLGDRILRLKEYLPFNPFNSTKEFKEPPIDGKLIEWNYRIKKVLTETPPR